MGGSGHALPQLPQWLGFVAVSTHWPPHAVWPPEQAETHVPPLQTCWAAHSVVQLPQCAGSLLVSTHCDPHLE